MLTDSEILRLLKSLHEHDMAKDIFVPILKKQGLKGVKFTGGPDEKGIDIEYYFYPPHDNKKRYEGMQFKQGGITYSSRGGRGTVKDVKNQAEEAFEKEIHDVDDHGVYYINRFIVACTGVINEPARQHIGAARQKGNDRSIDYWQDDKLIKMIRKDWMKEFEIYFAKEIHSISNDADKETIVDEDYIASKYSELVESSRRVIRIVNSNEKKLLLTIAELSVGNESSLPLIDLLMELGKPEDYYETELSNLHNYSLIEFDDDTVYLCGRAGVLQSLYETICGELNNSGESMDSADKILYSLVRSL